MGEIAGRCDPKPTEDPGVLGAGKDDTSGPAQHVVAGIEQPERVDWMIGVAVLVAVEIFRPVRYERLEARHLRDLGHVVE